MDTSKTQLIRLLDKAPPIAPSQSEKIQIVYTYISIRTVAKCKNMNRKEINTTKLGPTARVCWTGEGGNQFKSLKGMRELSQIPKRQRSTGMTS